MFNRHHLECDGFIKRFLYKSFGIVGCLQKGATHRAILTRDTSVFICLLNFLRKWVAREFNQDAFLFNWHAYHSEEAMEAKGTRGCCIMYSLDDQSFPLINIHSEPPK